MGVFGRQQSIAQGSRTAASQRRGRPDGASARLDTESLWRGGDYEIVRTHWSRHHHPSESEGHTAYAALEFMCRGSFQKQTNSEIVLGDPNSVVMFRPNEPFTVSHPSSRENHGITIRMGGFWRDPNAQRPSGRWVTRESSRRLVSPSVQLKLRALISDIRRDADAIAIEEGIVAIIAAVLACFGDTAAENESGDGRERAQDARRVAAMTEYLAENFARRINLNDIGDAIGCSSWHAARLFRRVNGIPIHQYLKRLRLSYALDAIANGCEDLTRLAFEAGFSSHSHLTAAFRSEYGMQPRAVRRRVSIRPDRCRTAARLAR